MVVSAGWLAGCGTSFDKEVEAGLVEKQVGEWKPSSASANPGPANPTTDQDRNTGQAVQARDNHPPASAPGNSIYRIGALDVLDISVFKAPDLTKSVQVADAGTVNLPLVGEVMVVGKTPQEVEHDLSRQLGSKYLKNPQVTVYVKEYNSQRVTIEGAIKKPGIYPIKGKTTLLQLIATAESLDRETASSDVAVFRMINGKRCAAKYDIDNIRKGTTEDPVMQNGDVIIVDTSTTKQVISGFFRFLPLATFVPLL
jgi:polysaccharide biosynthesis/export protein